MLKALGLGLCVAAMLTGCTKRQNPSTCVTGDQKSCACLGGGGGVQICLADGTYDSCVCPFGTDDMAAPTSPIEDMAAPVPAIDMVKLRDMSSSADAASFADVQADIDQLTCGLGGCHGGTQVPVLKAMATGTGLTNNYDNFMTDVSLGAPSQSLVLTKNLPGASHGGGSKFSGTSDPVYKRWLAWIVAGAPF